MKKYIEITCDINDGDYITKRSLINDEGLELIQSFINEIKNVKGHNFPNLVDNKENLIELYPDYFTLDEDGDLKSLNRVASLFFELIPDWEFGVHTIESIIILEVINEINLL